MSAVRSIDRRPGTDTRARAAGALLVRVHYPPGEGRLVLRADTDWERDLEPVVGARGEHLFSIDTAAPYAYFKPVLKNGHGIAWSVGENYLALKSQSAPLEIYPYFRPDETCSACELRSLSDPATGRAHQFRVFQPPGYYENTLRRYPVVYMQDGQNLFFPDESFQGQHWRIPETLNLLDAMNATTQVIVVGIYPNEREYDYTRPGYEDYGRFIVGHLKPTIDRDYRTLYSSEQTAVMGSSLGGVVSFYLSWQYPELFGLAACMSSTFGWRDDLFERVRRERRRRARIYLDSGWPQDNFEVTREMRCLLAQRGYAEGEDLFYFAFPEAAHNEAHWGVRAHLPLQLFFAQTKPSKTSDQRRRRTQ